MRPLTVQVPPAAPLRGPALRNRVWSPHHCRAQARGNPHVLPVHGRTRRAIEAESRRPGVLAKASAQAAAVAQARTRWRRCSTASQPAARSSCVTARMFELAYSCGLRCQEIVNLDVDSIDFDAEELRVLGKGSKTRVVPIGEPAQRAVERYLATGRPRAGRRAARAGAVRLEERPAAVAFGRASPSRGLASQRRASQAASLHMPCATRSQLTCSREAPTCARSRNCSAIPASRRPRSTLG